MDNRKRNKKIKFNKDKKAKPEKKIKRNKEIKKVNKFKKTSIALLTLVIILGSVTFVDYEFSVHKLINRYSEAKSIITKKISDTPEKVVKKFTQHILNNEYDEALAMIEKKEGSFNDINTFKSSMVDLGLKPMDDYSISTNYINEDKHKVRVLITNKDNSVNIEKNFSTILKDEEYFISSKELTIKDWTVIVPKGSTLYLNDKKIDIKPKEKTLNNNNKNKMLYDVYTIPMILKGEYTIKVTHPFLTSFTQKYRVVNNKAKKIDLNLKPDIDKKLQSAIEALLNHISSSAYQNKDFDTLIGTSIAKDSDELKSLESAYLDLRNRLTSDNKEYIYVYKNLFQSDINITKVLFKGGTSIDVEGSYVVEYDRKYSSEFGAEIDKSYIHKSKIKDFKVSFISNKNNKLLQVNSINIFNQL